MKTLVGTVNQKKALVGAFSVIVKTGCGTDGRFTPLVSSRQLAVSQETSAPSGHFQLVGLILETRDVTAGAGATAVATPRRRKLSAGPRVGPQAAGAPRHSARCLGGPWSEEVLLSGAQAAGARQKHHSLKCRMNVCRRNGKPRVDSKSIQGGKMKYSVPI